MLYERKMKHPIEGWGLVNNSFFYCDHKVGGLVHNFYCVTLDEKKGDRNRVQEDLGSKRVAGIVQVQKFKLVEGLKTDEKDNVNFSLDP